MSLSKFIVRNIESLFITCGSVFLADPITAIIWQSRGIVADPSQSLQPVAIALIIDFLALSLVWFQDDIIK